MARSTTFTMPRFRRMQAVLYLALAAYSLTVLVPLAWMVVSALKTKREIFVHPFALPAELQWGNFERAWGQGLGTYLANSLLVTAVSVALIVLTSTLAAYAIARRRFKGRFGLYLMIMAGYAVPVHTVLVPLYNMLDRAGLLNSYPGLILPYVAFGIPFSVVLLYAFFLEFPAEVEEAAKLDGCNDGQMLWHVVMPLSLPGIASVAIFQGVFTWNEFLLALLIMTDGAYKTLPAGLVALQGEFTTDWPAIMATVTIATLPLLVLFVALQKHFVRSLAGMGK